MPIISIKSNENNRWRRNAKKRTRGMEAIAKGWEINDFLKCLS